MGKKTQLKPDIFVDNNVAKSFSNPMDEEHKRFIKWLFEKGYLVVSKNLLTEYRRTIQVDRSITSVLAVIDRLTKEGRLIIKSNQELKQFQIKKHLANKLRSNKADHEYIKVVLLSDRKYALSGDTKLRYDISNYPGHKAVAVARPDEISYASKK